MPSHLADLQRRKLRRLMTLVAIFAYGPSALLITIGVLILVFGHATKDVVFGIMTLSLTVTLLGGVALTVSTTGAAGWPRNFPPTGHGPRTA